MRSSKNGHHSQAGGQVDVRIGETEAEAEAETSASRVVCPNRSLRAGASEIVSLTRQATRMGAVAEVQEALAEEISLEGEAGAGLVLRNRKVAHIWAAGALVPLRGEEASPPTKASSEQPLVQHRLCLTR